MLQYFIDLLFPSLNVDLEAGGFNVYHTRQEARTILRKFCGTPIYVYVNLTKSLIFLSYSKQWLYAGAYYRASAY